MEGEQPLHISLAMIESTTDAVDRIGRLPHSVLQQILSSMGIKFAVRTTVLSKKWQQRWASLPCLCFTDEDFPSAEAFRHLIDNALILRDPVDLESLELVSSKFDVESSIPHFRKWIHHAAKRAVRNLLITISSLTSFMELPSTLFTCKSLEQLSLHACADLKPSKLVSLHSLRRLNLVKIFLMSEGSLEALFSGSPVLEDLCLQRSYLVVSQEISSSSLKKLQIEDCDLSGTLTVSAPNLVSLIVRNCRGDVSVKNLHNLRDAVIVAEDYVDEKPSDALRFKGCGAVLSRAGAPASFHSLWYDLFGWRECSFSKLHWGTQGLSSI